MEKQNNLPVPVERNLPAKIKKAAVKTGKILGYSAAFLGLTIVSAAIPPLIVPAMITALYPAQKLLNETIYTSYPDLAFVLRKQKGAMKIYQDVVRPDILKEMRGLTNIEKAGFLQLQAIVGMSKTNGKDKNGNPIQFETDSHGIIRKAFQTLEDLGYVENYQETLKKNSHLFLPRLAFGNLQGTKQKTPVYQIQFQRTDRPIDFEDPKLKRLFPAIFSKRKGLLAKRNYQILTNPDGSLTIDYHAKGKMVSKKKKETLKERLTKGMDSLEEQRNYSLERQQAYLESEKEREEPEETMQK